MSPTQVTINPPAEYLVLAGVVFLVATVIKAFRLYISLGALRPSLGYTSAAHFTGASFGFLFGAFVYEIVVIITCSFKNKAKVAPILLSLMLLRGFDAVILVVIVFFVTSIENSRTLIFFLLLLITLIWVCIYAVNPILRRFERNLLESKSSSGSDAKIIHFSYTLRQNLKKLPWEKRGTIAMILLLSMLGWMFEWIAISLLTGTGISAAATIVGRVGSSLGLSLGYVEANLYAYVMPVIYVFSVILVAFALMRIRHRRKQLATNKI